jgi:hypothetical protein
MNTFLESVNIFRVCVLGYVNLYNHCHGRHQVSMKSTWDGVVARKCIQAAQTKV